MEKKNTQSQQPISLTEKVSEGISYCSRMMEYDKRDFEQEIKNIVESTRNLSITNDPSEFIISYARRIRRIEQSYREHKTRLEMLEYVKREIEENK